MYGKNGGHGGKSGDYGVVIGEHGKRILRLRLLEEGKDDW